MKKVSLDIDLPTIEWVDVPTNYITPLGEVDTQIKVNIIKDLIEYLQRIDGIQMIINSNHQHIRFPFCKSVVKDRIFFLNTDSEIHYRGEELSHFLQRFDEMSGLHFKDYTFKYQVASNGTKCHFVNWATAMYFNTEHEAICYFIAAHVRNETSKLKYEVKE